MSIALIIPESAHKQAALAYRQEYFEAGEMEIHGDGGLDHARTYELWLDKINKSRNGQFGTGYVPATTYFAVTDEKIVGTIQIRHELNDSLLITGGHIGYGVVPSERRKGYATRMLSLALDRCREMGLGRVLVTCDINNTGSAKTIIKNGGVLENEHTEENGNIVQRYWIDISSSVHI